MCGAAAAWLVALIPQDSQAYGGLIVAALTGFAKRETGASHPSPSSQNAPAVPRMDPPVPSAWHIFPFLIHLAASSSFLTSRML